MQHEQETVTITAPGCDAKTVTVKQNAYTAEIKLDNQALISKAMK